MPLLFTAGCYSLAVILTSHILRPFLLYQITVSCSIALPCSYLTILKDKVKTGERYLNKEFTHKSFIDIIKVFI